MLIIRRLIKIWFGISDVCAWLLLLLSGLSVVAYSVSYETFSELSTLDTRSAPVLVSLIDALAVAIGAYLLTQRRLTGLILMLVPAGTGVIWASWSGIVVWGLGVLLLFGIPFLLSYLELRDTLKG